MSHVKRYKKGPCIKDDEFKASQLPGGHFRITKEDFMDFLKKYNIPIKGWPFEEDKEK